MISKRALAIFFALIMVASGIGILFSAQPADLPSSGLHHDSPVFSDSVSGSGAGNNATSLSVSLDNGGSGSGSVSPPNAIYDVGQSTTFGVVAHPGETATVVNDHPVTDYHQVTTNLYYDGTSIVSTTSPVGSASDGSASTLHAFTSAGEKSYYITASESGYNSGTSGTAHLWVFNDPTGTVSGVSSINIDQPTTYSLSISGGYGAYTIQWYMDGSPVGSNSTTYAFEENTPNTYALNASISDQTGYIANTNTMQIDVINNIVFSASSQINPSDVGQTIQYSTTASGGSGSYTYAYSLYDGTSVSDSVLASGTSPDFSYTFQTSGSFLLDYSLSDSNGVKAYSSLTQVVNPDPSISIASRQNPTDVGNSVTFSSSVSGGTSGYSYSWSVNGNAYDTPDASASFSSPGTYLISLTVTDAAAYAVTQTMDETVNTDPTVTASSSVSSADIGYAIEFSSTPSGGSGSYGYSWTLNGNQI